MGWLAFATAALAATAPAQQADDTAPKDAAPEIEVIDLERERYDRLTIPVFIGDHGPFPFMIDTGAQATVLSRALADRIGLLEREPALLIGMASQVEVEVVRVRDLSIGDRVFDIEIAPLVEQMHIGGAEGILGLDSLQDQRVLLDFTKRTIAVADAEDLGGNRGYEIVVRARRKLGQLIITRADLDGIKVAVIVDTGAQGSVGNMKLQERLRAREVGMARMTDVNGITVEGSVGLAPQVRIGRAAISNVPIAFADSPTFAALGLDDEPALVLGMSELKLFRRVAIDFKQRKVLFDMPRGVERESVFQRSTNGRF